MNFFAVRFWKLCAFGWVASATLHPSALADEVAESKLVVHEWGVLGVGNAEGTSVLGATERYLESLPDFVTRAKPPESQSPTDLIIYKPVIHFYGGESQSVEVTIKFATGYPLVYYPSPFLPAVAPPPALPIGPIPVPLDRDPRPIVPPVPRSFSGSDIHWKFQLSRKNPGTLVSPPAGHWWNHAREIPSDYLTMEDGSASERFLFYEGTTTKNPTITATVKADSIIVRNIHHTASSPIIILINDAGTLTGTYLDSVPSNSTRELPRRRWKPWDEAAVIAHCRRQWEACGMSPEESAGIANCWRPELLETPGFLLISRLPPPLYDEIFPIVVKPEPSELKRACLVFDTLSGQNPRKQWLPGLAKECATLIDGLSNENYKSRVEAQAKLVALGEAISPFLNDLISDPNADPQAKLTAVTIRVIIEKSPVCTPRIPPLTFQRFDF